MDGFEKVSCVFRCTVYLNEGAGIVHIRTGHAGWLGYRKQIGENSRVRGEDAAEDFEDDVLCLDHDISVVIPDVLTSDEGSWGNERGHVVHRYLEGGHCGPYVGVLQREAGHGLEAGDDDRCDRNRLSLPLVGTLAGAADL